MGNTGAGVKVFDLPRGIDDYRVFVGKDSQGSQPAPLESRIGSMTRAVDFFVLHLGRPAPGR